MSLRFLVVALLGLVLLLAACEGDGGAGAAEQKRNATSGQGHGCQVASCGCVGDVRGNNLGRYEVCGTAGWR